MCIKDERSNKESSGLYLLLDRCAVQPATDNVCADANQVPPSASAHINLQRIWIVLVCNSQKTWLCSCRL